MKKNKKKNIKKKIMKIIYGTLSIMLEVLGIAIIPIMTLACFVS